MSLFDNKDDKKKPGRMRPPTFGTGRAARSTGGQLTTLVKGGIPQIEPLPAPPPVPVQPPKFQPAWAKVSAPEAQVRAPAPPPARASAPLGRAKLSTQQKQRSAIQSQDDGSGAGTSLAQASGGQDLETDKFAGMNMKTISKEVFRVNVMRGLYKPDKRWIIVSANTTPTVFGVNYNPNDRYDANGQYRVTVPAVMLFDVDEDRNNRTILDDDYRNYQGKHLVDSYRYQFGNHLMVSNLSGNPVFHQTYWKKSSKQNRVLYLTESQFNPIACVYPCLAAGGQRLVLGLGFCDKRNIDEEPNSRIRTYGRKSAVGEEKNDYCFDVTEEFITDQILSSDQILSFRNDKLFPSRSDLSSTAFYVCRGAKLLVLDQRFEGLVAKKDGRFGHCRSLFLEGSLVVVRGMFMSSLAIVEKNKSNHSLLYWTELCRHHVRPDYIKGPNSMINKGVEKAKNFDTDLKDDSRLIDIRRKVIFLGATESEHNSVCWKLSINKDDSTNKPSDHADHLAYLMVPEGGYIEDMTTWKYGFKLIYDRHRYERLFESVLEMANGTQLPAEQYQVPKAQFVDRILGVSEDKRQAMICPKYEALKIPRDFENLRHDTDRDLRRYMALQAMTEAREGQMDAKWILNEQLNTQPQWHIDTSALRHFLPSPPLYPNCFQKVGGEWEMLVVGPDLRIVNSKPDQGQKPDIFNMEFKIVNPDTNAVVLDNLYKLHKFNHYGHLWQSRNERNTPDMSRLARDARWQTVESRRELNYLAPEIKGLLLVKTDLDEAGLPWYARMQAGFYHRFGYHQDDSDKPYGFEQKL